MQRRELLKASMLAGVALANPSLIRAVQAGVQAGATPPKAVFTEAQRRSVALLSDMIIPPTDTPGAVAAGVPDFVETIVGEWYRPTEREIFFRGLKELDAYCEEHAGKAFHQAPEEARIAALEQSEKAAASYAPPQTGGSLVEMGRSEDENAPFFNKLKGLVVLGYYTSEVGAREELAYNPVPGRFDGDYDFEKVGRQWIL